MADWQTLPSLLGSCPPTQFSPPEARAMNLLSDHNRPLSIDLHIHTHFSSDGDLSPQAIVEAAHQARLAVIAIADHDSVAGVEEAEQHCLRYGLRLIPAVEISTQYGDQVLHVLAYCIDIHDSALLSALEATRQYELRQVQTYINRLNDRLNFRVSLEEVLALSPRSVPKLAIIAKAIMTNERNVTDDRLRPYRTGDRANQPYYNFYLDYLQAGRPAYVTPTGYLPTLDAITLVQHCRGLPVLAHPGASLQPQVREGIIDNLAGHGLAGIEAFSSYHSPETETWFQAYAEKRSLLVTAGSDFHGPTVKPDIGLGKVSNNSLAVVEKLDHYWQKVYGSSARA
jgi:3',5'-nucleoside bisphosphate phosphatase